MSENAPTPDLQLSDVSSDDPYDQDIAARSGHRSLLDHDDIGTLGDGQIDAAATGPSPDAPNDELSAR